MVETFLMWFPACALFITLAFVVESEWLELDNWIKRGLFARLFQAQVREAQLRDDRPLVYLENGYPWQHEQWWKV